MRKLKRAFILFFVLINGYGLLCGVIYFFQEQLIFHPNVLPADYRFSFATPFEEVFLDTDDGARLHGLHFRVDKPKGAILYFHGNAGDAQRWGTIAEFFVAKGYDVILMDYRGYGKSTGLRSETNLYADAELWYAFAKAQYDPSQLILYGRSLGTAFATYVASQNPSRNLVLETPLYSMEQEAASRFRMLPVKRLLQYKLPTYSHINAVNCPITMIHGTEDEVVDYIHGKQLYDECTSTQKKFITIEGGHHNDLVLFPKYLEVIDEVLRK